MVIEAVGLGKQYRVNDHRSGRGAAIKDLLAPRYKLIRALNQLDLRIEPGEMLGVIGPNGAGKSTLIKLLSGVLVPTSGQVLSFGLTPHRHRSRLARQIGVMFGQRTQLWWDLPVLDSLRLHQVMYDVPETQFQENLKLFDELLELGPLLNKAVRQLSLGQKTRAELALVLLHSPQLLFLDEPTIGLDVLVKERIRAFLRRVNEERGMTVVLTSHDMTDVEEVCRRVLIINEGEALFDGSLEAVKRQYVRERTIRLTLASAVQVPEWPGVRVLKSEGLVQTLAFAPDEIPVAELLTRIVTSLPVADIALEDPGIESVIKLLRLGGGEDADVDSSKGRFRVLDYPT